MSNKDSEAPRFIPESGKSKDNRRKEFVDNNRIMTLIMTVRWT